MTGLFKELAFGNLSQLFGDFNLNNLMSTFNKKTKTKNSKPKTSEIFNEEVNSSETQLDEDEVEIIAEEDDSNVKKNLIFELSKCF